jgi:hypothetical protein
LTGFGATKEAWLAAHEQAPGFTESAAFLPMVKRDGESLPKYAGVSVETPVVVYIINLPNGTTLADARRIVLAEFPRGAEFDVEDKDEPACLIASIKSPPVQRGLRRHGYGNWVPIVAFGTHTATETRLDPENVTDVSMFVSEPSRSDLGLC